MSIWGEYPGVTNVKGESVAMRKVVAGFAVILWMAFPCLALAADGASKASEEQTVARAAGERHTSKSDPVLVPPRELLRDIHIPRNTAVYFDGIYARHQKEIQKIINENPEMIWPAVDLFLDALPALRDVSKNSGKLLVDCRVYDKANQLLAQCETKASVGFGDDLKKVRAFVEKRSKRLEGKKVSIDLN
jgi:hypothetical protein